MEDEKELKFYDYIFYEDLREDSPLNVVNRFGLEKCKKVLDLYYDDWDAESIAEEVGLTIDQVALVIMSKLEAYEEERGDKNVSAYYDLYDTVKSFLFDGYKGLNYLATALDETRKQLDLYDYWNDKDLDEKVQKRFK